MRDLCELFFLERDNSDDVEEEDEDEDDKEESEREEEEDEILRSAPCFSNTEKSFADTSFADAAFDRELELEEEEGGGASVVVEEDILAKRAGLVRATTARASPSSLSGSHTPRTLSFLLFFLIFFFLLFLSLLRFFVCSIFRRETNWRFADPSAESLRSERWCTRGWLSHSLTNRDNTLLQTGAKRKAALGREVSLSRSINRYFVRNCVWDFAQTQCGLSGYGCAFGLRLLRFGWRKSLPKEVLLCWLGVCRDSGLLRGLCT